MDQLSAVACLQVATSRWTAIADLVHAAGPALSVAHFALPAFPRVPSAEPADEAGAQHSDGLRLAFSGTTSGSIAVWDLSLEQPTDDDDLVQVIMLVCHGSCRLSFFSPKAGHRQADRVLPTRVHYR